MERMLLQGNMKYFQDSEYITVEFLDSYFEKNTGEMKVWRSDRK